jgi:beta-glucosidase
MKDKILKFPDNFLWGSSTSSHQVEGLINNDWSAWELENCRTLASEARSDYLSKGKNAFLAPLREKIRAMAEDPENYVSGQACDHYNRFNNDFDLARQLNHNAHRISIEWSRVEPEAFITLWHFTNPLWLRDKGGWKRKDAIKYFACYVNKVVDNLKDNVRYWITLNEPMVYATSSFLYGRFPAQEKNPVSFFLAIDNLIKAHRSAHKVIKRESPEAQVGIAKNIIYFDAYKNRAFNKLIKISVDWLWNDYFLNRIKFHQDFIGVNHYFHNRINFGLNKNENKVLSDMGWELYPEAIYHSLKEVRKYMKPIYITESGLADAGDSNRAWYIKEILKNVHRAITENVNVRGYLYWSLLDNFEWHKGFWPRFGLLEVDFKNFDRKIRKSALEYAKIIEDNGIVVNERQ